MAHPFLVHAVITLLTYSCRFTCFSIASADTESSSSNDRTGSKSVSSREQSIADFLRRIRPQVSSVRGVSSLATTDEAFLWSHV